jgi:hypothetical protein
MPAIPVETLYTQLYGRAAGGAERGGGGQSSSDAPKSEVLISAGAPRSGRGIAVNCKGLLAHGPLSTALKSDCARARAISVTAVVVSFVMLKKTHSLNFSGDALLHLELSPRLRNATSLVVTHTIGGRLYAAYLHHL